MKIVCFKLLETSLNPLSFYISVCINLHTENCTFTVYMYEQFNELSQSKSPYNHQPVES